MFHWLVNKLITETDPLGDPELSKRLNLQNHASGHDIVFLTPIIEQDKKQNQRERH